MDVIKRVRHYVNQWYVQCLVATELYMVEPWEKVIMYVVFFTLFGFVSYFNYSIVLNAVSQLRDAACSVRRQEEL